MLQKIRLHPLGWFVLLCIYAISWYLQDTLFISWDVSWGLIEAKRLLAGGTYFTDFYEMTPPMFLYLYIPVILLTQFLPINIDHALRIYLFVLSSLSLFICYPLIQQIFIRQKQDTQYAFLFFLMIAVAFLLLPLPTDSGQREHLMVILTMPYFLLMCLRLEKISGNNYYAAAIGFLAGIGFAIKPYFIISLALIELYHIFYTRKLFVCFRPETFSMIGVFLLYGISTYFLFPNYIHIILPLAMHTYYQGYSTNLAAMLCLSMSVDCGLVTLFYVASYRNNPYKILSTVFLIGMLGFWCSYVLQRTTWYYHVFPAYSFALILAVLLFSLLVTRIPKKRSDYLLMSIFFLANLLLYIYIVNGISNALVFYPIGFFIFFAILFAVMFYLLQAGKNYWRILSAILTTITIGGYVSYLMHYDNWYPYRMLTTIAILMAVLLLWIPAKKNKGHVLFSALLGMLIFACPFYSATIRYWSAIRMDKGLLSMVEFLKKHANHQPIYFLSNGIHYEFPAVDYAGAIPASRFPSLVWMPAYLNQMRSTKNQIMDAQLLKDHNFFVTLVADEINKKKPVLIFADVFIDRLSLELHKNNYVAIFLKNPQFQSAWKPYKYLTTIQHDSLYQFDVYQRRE